MAKEQSQRERAIVIGAGGISAEWFKYLKAEKVQVVAVVDLRKAAAEARIAEFKLKDAIATDSVSWALSHFKADFVVDLTTPESHCAVTCAALKAGFHVIGEKPMAASIIEARRMVHAAEISHGLYMVSQSRRWEPPHEGLAKAVASGKIGALTTVNCDFFLGAHFGGFRDHMQSPLILDMAIHHFDMARLISGKDPVGVYAKEFNPKGSWYRGDVAANCIFEMTDGVQFAYRGSWCSEGFPTSWAGNWRIIGERGTILYEYDQPPKAQVVAKEEGFMRPYKDIKVPIPAMKHVRMHGALREMLHFLRTGEKPQTECHDNIKSFAMVMGAIESSRKGKPVTIDV